MKNSFTKTDHLICVALENSKFELWFEIQKFENILRLRKVQGI